MKDSSYHIIHVQYYEKSDNSCYIIILGKMHLNVHALHKILFVSPFLICYSRYLYVLRSICETVFKYSYSLRNNNVIAFISFQIWRINTTVLIHNTGIVFACWSTNNIYVRVHVLNYNVHDYRSIIPLFSIMRFTCTCFFWQTKPFNSTDYLSYKANVSISFYIKSKNYFKYLIFFTLPL